MKLTDEQIKIIARHAAEGAELQARQQNDRIEMMERQRAEQEAAGLVSSRQDAGIPARTEPPAEHHQGGHNAAHQAHPNKGRKSRE